MPGLYNVSLPAGDTFIRTFTWEDEAGNLVDLAGYDVYFTVFDTNQTVILEADTGTVGGITLEPTAGSVVVEFQTVGADPGCYQYTLVFVSSTGVITTLLQGSFDLE